MVDISPFPDVGQVRYHGVLAPSASWRADVVPLPPAEPPGLPPEPARARRYGPPGNPRRLPWAELMRRVFALDVLECPSPCGGRLRILAAIHDRDVIRAILD